MAIATDIESPVDMPMNMDGSISLADDRARVFRRARRHSVLVRVLKILFPALSLGVVALYIGLFFHVANLVPAVDKSLTPRILPENLTMKNPRYEGYAKDGGSYLVQADSASQSLAQTNLVSLSRISGLFVDGAKARTTLTAARGEFDTKTNILELFDSIDVASGNGLTAKLTRATFVAKEGIVTSGEPVAVDMPAGSIRSNRMTLRQKLKEATFVEAVIARLNASGAPPKARDPASAKGGAAPERPFFGASGEPMDVTANRLDVNDAAKTAIFSGDVKAVQGEAAITTPELQIFYEGAPAESKPDGAAGQPSKLRRVLAKEPVVLTRGESERVTAKSAEFDAAGEKAILAGNVVIASLPDRQAQGDRAEFDMKTNTALLTGAAVVVTQANNVLQGRRLFIDRAKGLTQLSAPAAPGAPAGRIQARLYQKGGKPKSGETPAAPEEKSEAAVGGLGGGAFKTDPNAPIDIAADTLNVDDPARTATFRGAVLAKQGDFAIAALELQAHYTGQIGIADQGAASNGAGADITHIDARGKVVITAKNGQTAAGDRAKFDIKTNTAAVLGNVTLTQGRNVVAGRRLDIDMATGEATIGGGDGEAAGPPAPGAVTAATPAPAGGESQRPSAVFYPKDLKDKGQGKAAPALKALEAMKPGAAGAIDGWSSTTTP